MSKILWILVFILIGSCGIRFARYYKEVNQRVEDRHKSFQHSAPADLGMPAELEPLLISAQKKGAGAMKQWLDQYRHLIKEPRLSEIELDYVILLGRSDPPEARRVFAIIRSRNGEDSPLADRIEKLSKTYN